MVKLLVQINLIALTACYVFGFYYTIHGLLLLSPRFKWTKLPASIGIRMANFLIILGVYTIIVSSIGCYGLPDNTLFMAWNIMSSIVIIVCLIILAIHTIILFIIVDELIREYLEKLLEHYSFSEFHKLAMDTIQINNKCCGIDSSLDWLPEPGIPKSCLNPAFLQSGIETETDAKLNSTSRFLKIIRGYKNGIVFVHGCFLPYKWVACDHFKIIILITTLNFLSMCCSVFTGSTLFMQAAVRKKEKCRTAILAMKNNRKRMVKEKNKSGKNYKSAPTQYDKAFEQIQLTPSEKDIISSDGKLKRIWRKVFLRRTVRFEDATQEQQMSQDEKYERAMIHWMYYF